MGISLRLFGLVLALWTLAQTPAAALELAARDTVSGAPVDAVLLYPHEGRTRQLRLTGRLEAVEPPARPVQAIARAAGYRDLRLTLYPAASRMTLLLDPLHEPDALQRISARTLGDPSARWMQGWVRRAEDGSPVPGARIQFEGRLVRSDAEGHFEIELRPCGPGDLSRSRLRVSADGLGEQVFDGLLCTPGIQTRLIALDAKRAHAQESIGALDRPASALAGAGVDPSGPVFLPDRARTPLDLAVAPGLAPPPSIRVGFADAACTASCCTASCTHTCTFSLETYVRRGLNDEWISSWNQSSLRAGSIAYRSYGAWRVDHPIRPAFDICSSACCQVNAPNTVSSTDSAVARTPGMMLMRGGSGPISSEYSAENNGWDDPDDGRNCSNADLSCGNGFVGSPATGWPCLADAVAAGRGCFGHGRGMSQWGSFRWGDAPHAKFWPWIVDHYYNANGAGSGLRTAVMSSPVSLQNVQTQPAALVPGASFLIQVEATNAAGAAHDHLLIGASLYRSGVGYIDDSANDAPLALAPGSASISRSFDLPAGVAPGSYDLWVSLYLDVDEDGEISSADLSLALVTAPGAVQVGDGGLFEDGFEATP